MTAILPYHLFPQQIKLILEALNNHLGIKLCYTKLHKILYTFYFTNTHIFFYIASCSSCAKDNEDNNLNRSLLHIYIDFITDLQRNLLRTVNEYSDWYTFKSNSSLKEFLEKKHIYISKYFRSFDLINAVKRATDLPFFNSQNNSQLVTLEPELQIILGQCIIYEPHIWTHLISHVQNVTILLSVSLQNEHIKKSFRIDVPDDIIYQNASSHFWLHPHVNNVLTQNKQLLHTWNNLLSSFFDLCTEGNDYFSRENESLVRINPNTSLTPLFSFNCFHIDQCESILKQLTRFVGKYISLADICPNLGSEYIFHDYITNENSKYKNVFMFIEDTINNNINLFSEVRL